jgi:hypothetical protein
VLDNPLLADDPEIGGALRAAELPQDNGNGRDTRGDKRPLRDWLCHGVTIQVNLQRRCHGAIAELVA